MKKEIVIDGRMGEGGGQVLRSSLTLSLVSGRPLRITSIRAGRRKPGLMRQHLACVRAAVAISDGSAEGAELHSQEVFFQPGKVKAGTYSFPVGSAGSTGLVLQTVLLPLLLTNGRSIVQIEGGTHNAWSPPFDFLEQSFLPQLCSMGAEVSLEMNTVGFFPAGGGSITATIDGISPMDRSKTSWSLLQRGPEISHHATLRRAMLPIAVADREWDSMKASLAWNDDARIDVEHSESTGPGNAVHTTLRFQNVTETVSSFGARNKSARQVGLDAAKESRRYLHSDAPVGVHLADQLLLPLLMLGGGSFRTLPLTMHTETNMKVIQAVYPQHVQATEKDDGSVLIEVSSAT